MKKIDWYYVGAMVVVAYTYVQNDAATAVFVGMGWILGKKAFKTD